MIWLAAITAGVVTLALKGSFIVAGSHRSLPSALDDLARFLTPALLAALAARSLIGAAGTTQDAPVVLAGAATAVVAALLRAPVGVVVAAGLAAAFTAALVVGSGGLV